jgi:hypothetical protein
MGRATVRSSVAKAREPRVPGVRIFGFANFIRYRRTHKSDSLRIAEAAQRHEHSLRILRTNGSLVCSIQPLMSCSCRFQFDTTLLVKTNFNLRLSRARLTNIGPRLQREHFGLGRGTELGGVPDPWQMLGAVKGVARPSGRYTFAAAAISTLSSAQARFPVAVSGLLESAALFLCGPDR